MQVEIDLTLQQHQLALLLLILNLAFQVLIENLLVLDEYNVGDLSPQQAVVGCLLNAIPPFLRET